MILKLVKSRFQNDESTPASLSKCCIAGPLAYSAKVRTCLIYVRDLLSFGKCVNSEPHPLCFVIKLADYIFPFALLTVLSGLI